MEQIDIPQDEALEPFDEKPKPTCTRIRLEWSDGTVREASGADAQAINEHWNGLEVFAHVHGQRYRGPCLKEVKSEENNEGDVPSPDGFDGCCTCGPDCGV